MSRRHFFYGTLLAGVVPAGGFCSVPSLKALEYKSPKEKLHIACIGAAAGRGRVRGCEGENFVAFDDPDTKRAEEMYKKFDRQRKYTHFSRMVDKEANNVDAVIIATRDHTHRGAWSAASTCTSRSRSPVRFGNRGKIIWSGEIGNVTEVHATMRPAWPQRITEIPKRIRCRQRSIRTPGSGSPKRGRTLSAARDTQSRERRTRCSGSFSRCPAAFFEPFNRRGFSDFGCGPLADIACHLLGAVHVPLLRDAPTAVKVIQQEGKEPVRLPEKVGDSVGVPARKNMSPVQIHWYDAATGPMFRSAGYYGIGAADRRSGGVWQDPNVYGGDAPALGSGTRRRPAEAARIRGTRTGRVCRREGISDYTNLWRERSPAERIQAVAASALAVAGHDWIRACKGGEPACSNVSVAGPFTE